MSPTSRPWARFDDLRASTRLRYEAGEVLSATRTEDVLAVLTAVDAATADGAWAFGYLAYEAAPGLDSALPSRHAEATGMPLAWFGLGGPPEPAAPLSGHRRSGNELWTPLWTDAEHAAAVAAVHTHIAAGETYQCNLTDRLVATFDGSSERLYADLVLAQQGAYHAYLDLGRYAVASATPELFFEWTEGKVRTRPMKGTSRRGANFEEDVGNARRLRASPKERAENLMIVDLMRNDLARLGDVAVTELFTLERYPTVWQLTSEITARLRPGTGLADLFRALFPCGSVTGAPKLRTMRLIEELEPWPRGVYCGAVGFVAPPSEQVRARFGVAIRTAVVDRDRRTATYGAGGAITWDSDAVDERAELMAKTAVLGTTPVHRG